MMTSPSRVGRPLETRSLPHSDITPGGVEAERRHLVVLLHTVDGQLPLGGRRPHRRRIARHIEHHRRGQSAPRRAQPLFMPPNRAFSRLQIFSHGSLPFQGLYSLCARQKRKTPQMPSSGTCGVCFHGNGTVLTPPRVWRRNACPHRAYPPDRAPRGRWPPRRTGAEGAQSRSSG